MTLEETITERLKEMEKELAIYQAFVNAPTTSEDDRKVVSFKVLYEMMAFSAIQKFVPGYIPSNATFYMLTSNGLQKMAGYASIKDDKVTISPEYKTLLTQRDEYIKNNKKN